MKIYSYDILVGSSYYIVLKYKLSTILKKLQLKLSDFYIYNEIYDKMNGKKTLDEFHFLH